MKVLFIGLGGFLGAISRYSVYQLTSKYIYEHIYLGTLFVNVIGCFLAGFFLNIISKEYLSHPLSAMLFIGFLGAFTTFSALSTDVLNFVQIGKVQIGIIHALANFILCMVAVFIGNIIGKAI